MWSDWLVFCDYGFSASAVWCPLATPTILLGFLLPWPWGISSQLLQQSATAAPYLGWGRPSWPWTWSSSSRPSCACLIDRVPDELWTKVCDIVQETGIKTIPKEKKCKKAKWLSGEALQIAVKRREVKSKGEKERYKHLNAEFQRIARRDKKGFLSNQCKK